ncbi:MAG: PKD domain-containing protein [Planctomycetia bacterium]|nr:PKD domain-containing protein [Planctomycetia bacterium]
MHWRSWVRDGWLGTQLGLRKRRPVRDDGRVRGWRVRRLEERRVLSVTSVEAGPNQAGVNEGSEVDVNATFEDDDVPGNNPHTATIDWGDGSTATAGVIDEPNGGNDGEVTGSHFYADDGIYTVTVTVTGDDGTFQSDTFTVTVVNVNPTVTATTNRTVDEGTPISITNIGTITDPGYDTPPAGGGVDETFTFTIDWGDGSTDSAGTADIDDVGGPGDLTNGSFDGSHEYADDGVYTVTITVTDDNGGTDTDTFTITVNNVAPTLTATTDRTTDEGTPISITNIGTFTDPGYDTPPAGGVVDETFTFTIDWGDGSTDSAGTATVDDIGGVGDLTDGSFDGSHEYADDGIYTVTLTITDDDGDSDTATFTITVSNIAPTLTVATDRSTDEGTPVSIQDIGTFTDPGYDTPPAGGAVNETFTFTIDWGDGSTDSAGTATIDTAGGVGVLTQGSFDGSHEYADDGIYTVTVTITDDDGGTDTETFTITVNNVAPTLTVVTDRTTDEGTQVSITNIGAFTDPGYDTPPAGGAVNETFTFTIDWGDGTTDSAGTATIDDVGGVGDLTDGSFEGSHTYADDGTYTVTVTITDDDGGTDTETFTITVNNVAPTLTVSNRTTDEGTQATFTNIGSFTDPGFNNPSNPIPGGETSETFTYTIDWGDGTAGSAGSATIDDVGGAGDTTDGSFDGSHTYADNGMYTVTVTVFDDDGGQHQRTFTITVANVDPTLTVVGNQVGTEDTPISITNIGTFTDPGFDNPSNPLPGEQTETFTFEIDWGDGSMDSAGSATIDTPGGIGVLTAGSFDGSHTYTTGGNFTVTVTVFDDDGGFHTQTFEINVAGIPPVLNVIGNQSTNEGTQIALNPVGNYTNVDPNATHTATIDWGDGTTTPGTIAEGGGAGTISGSHTYADNGIYTVTVTVFDDDNDSDSGQFTITVANVAPTLAVVVNQASNEGAQVLLIDIGTFTDPGFDTPPAGGAVNETFTFSIDWGDGTTSSNGAGTIDTPGAAGTPTAGSFNGTHTYADDGIYTVTVTVADDDGGSHQLTFTITVANVAPTLVVSGNQAANEGATVNLTNIGSFTDPGFDNPLNPLPGEQTETFTFTVDWGDGTAGFGGTPTIDTTGSAGTPTAGSFDGSHAYADDGVYTVTVTVFDDDGGFHQQTFSITVNNVAPTINTAPGAGNEGDVVTVTFTDPGFNNFANPIPNGEIAETFSYSIDWGDGIAEAGIVFSGVPGGPGVLTSGLVGHVFADNGIYLVTVQFFDDDGGVDTEVVQVTVTNVAPTLTVVGDRVTDEGTPIIINDIGSFTDPGFDNASNPLPGEQAESFTYSIDWGDGSIDSAGAAPDANGSPGVSSSGFFGGGHVYADNGNYTVTVTINDDDGGMQQRTFNIVVNNVAPVVTNLFLQDIGSDATGNLNGEFADPGADSWTITIEWSDGQPNDVYQVLPGAPTVFAASHLFDSSGLVDPSAPIPIRITIMDDDGGVVVQLAEFQVPGTGLVSSLGIAPPAAPSLAPLTQANRTDSAPQSNTAASATVQATGDNAAGGDTAGEEDVREIVLRIIRPDGDLVRDAVTGRVKELLLTEAQLKDLRDFFRIWPDGHYRIDLREGKAERLIIEVYVREGEMVDPADLEDLDQPSDDVQQAPPEAAAPEQPVNDASLDRAWETWQPRGRRAATPPVETDVELKQNYADQTTSLDLAAAGLVGMASRIDAVPAAKRFWHRRSIRSSRPTTTPHNSRP